MTTDLYFSLLGKGLTPKTIAISINDSKTLQTLFEMRLTHRCWHKQQCLQCHGIPHHNGLMTMGKEPNHKTGLKQCEMDNRPFTCIDDIVNCLCWGILETRKPIIILFRFICRWEAAPEDYVSVKKMFRKFTKLQRKSEEKCYGFVLYQKETKMCQYTDIMYYLDGLLIFVDVYNTSLRQSYISNGISCTQTKNRPTSQIPQCICPISHNSPFRTEMYTFLFWMVNCGIWGRCIVGCVRSVNSAHGSRFVLFCYGFSAPKFTHTPSGLLLQCQ